MRLPQEDMCQATGTPPQATYEADGGPGMDRILDVLDGSMTRDADRRTFFRAQMNAYRIKFPFGPTTVISTKLEPWWLSGPKAMT